MRAADLDLARKALAKGWLADDQLRGVLAEADRYQALGLEKGVDEILLERGLLAPEQVKELREALGLTLKSPRVGDYEVIRRIGMGGMGTVFEARHVRLAQRIALKILQPRHARDPQTAERFLTEARTLARLNHPNLVHAMDAGKDGDRFYLAMELVPGENLLQIVQRDGPLEPLRSLAIVKAVCRALGALEEKGLVHRDVKPANILVSAGGQIHLADFGLLVPVDDGAQEAGPLCGTPHYLAPEQAQRQGIVDHRSDLYALAATWYHILAGRPPFVGKSTREIVRAHLQQAPAPPSSLRPGIPRALDALILRWLSKDRSQRPASCSAALEELEALERAIGPRAARRGWALGGLAAVALALAFLAWRPWRPGATPEVAVIEAPTPSASPSPAAPLPDPPDPTTPAPAVPAPTPVRPAAAPPPPAASDPAELTGRTPPAGTVAPAREAPPLPAARPPFLAWRRRLGDGAELLRREVAAGLSRIREELPAFRERRPLLLTFHATRKALAPGPAFLVRLEYDLDAADELRDFRWRPGSWRLEAGGLERTAAGPAADGVWSVGWFATPLSIEGSAAREAPLVLGLGALRIAPGSAADAVVWWDSPDEAAPLAALPPLPAGPFRVAISPRQVEIQVGSRAAIRPTPAAAEGRLLLEARAGLAIESLIVEGLLEPAWAEARLQATGRSGPDNRSREAGGGLRDR